ncbi:MAG: hypothetical protein MZW92_67485 [Comamonadaceae bacterium]|nr:hypothetical protein [Comamonadaceae bacterium]
MRRPVRRAARARRRGVVGGAGRAVRRSPSTTTAAPAATAPPAWARLFLDDPNPPQAGGAHREARCRRLEASRRPRAPALSSSRRRRRLRQHRHARRARRAVDRRGAARGRACPRRYDHVRNIFVLVVNSLATPPNDWNRREDPPGMFDVLLKATGTPIDRYSYDTVETLRDIQCAVGDAARDPRRHRASIRSSPRKLQVRHAGAGHQHPGHRRVVRTRCRTPPSGTTSTRPHRRSCCPTPRWTGCASPPSTRSSRRPRYKRLIDNGALRVVGPGPARRCDGRGRCRVSRSRAAST